MAKVAFDDGVVQIPAWVVDLASFRRWWESDDFPEEGRICFINGEVWADMSRQQIFSHLRVKATINTTIDGLARKAEMGLYLPGGLRVFHTEADLSAVPDSAFLSYESIRAGRVRLIEGKEGGYTAVEGSPDLVIEVVSDRSEDKDLDWQMSAYWNAGIHEYWLIDARKEPLRFDIYKHGPKGFTAARKSAGWIKSAVLGKSFHLATVQTPLGITDFELQVR